MLVTPTQSFPIETGAMRHSGDTVSLILMIGCAPFTQMLGSESELQIGSGHRNCLDVLE